MALARGLELAAYQPVVDWPTLIAATGISFVMVKASEAGARDPLFQQHWAEARKAGLLRGAYHFLRQSTDPQQQVDTFLQALGDDPGDLPPTLDIEDPRANAPAQYAAGAQLWLRQVENAVVESARDVGANGFQIFLNILLPLSLRSAVIVFCLNVIGVFGAFTIPYLLGGAQPMMMGVSMQQTFNNYSDRVGALTQAVITFLLCAVVGLLYVRTVSKRQERT